MRLIGIQALLGLLQQRISAKAEAHGSGTSLVFDTVGVSNAGVVGNASAVGSAAASGITSGRISGIGNTAGTFGSATGIGVMSGLFVGIGSAVSHGSSAVVGEIKGLTAGIAQASSHGTATATPSSFATASGAGSAAAQGVIIGTNATVGFASGVGSSNLVAEDALAVAGIGAAQGTGSSSVVGIVVAVAATGAAQGTGSSSVVGTRNYAGEFIARTSGLDSTHITAYTDLINGLVSDGVWSKLDVLYIFATSSTGNALLNLISSSFTGTSHGSPTFTTDRGYTGVDASTTVYIDSGFNPTTASSPKFVTNSCHVSAWCVTAVTAGSTAAGVFIGAGSTTPQTALFGRYSDGKAYFRINDNPASAGITNASSVGHWIANRTGSSASTAYKNGTNFGTPNAIAGTLFNLNMFVLAFNSSGSPTTGTGGQLAMASIGAGLTATDATNFYNRLRTYMTSVGVP